MEKLIFQYKKISFSIFSLVLFYLFILQPLENIKSQKKILKTKNEKFLILEKKESIIVKNIQDNEKKLKKLKLQYSEKKENIIFYNSLGETQKNINYLIDKNGLKVLELGRITNEEDNVILIPFLLTGKENNVLNFLFNLDENDAINIFNAPIEIFKEKENIKLRFSIQTTILNKKNSTDKKNLDFVINRKNNYELVKFKLLDEKKGIFYIKSNSYIKKYYLKDSTKQNVNGNLCNINLTKNLLIIEELKNKNKIILYLEDNHEKN